MATDDPIRASDSDREVVVAALQDAYTAGRITMEEFDERTSAAYAAKTWGDLRKLTIDLPAQPILGGDVPGRRFASAPPLDRQSPGGQLPSHPPRANLPPSRARRPRHRAAFIIPLLVWVLIVVRADTPGSNGTVLVVIAIMAVVALLAATRRR
jgi:Domain of unknown function (DUF1707)